MRKNYQREHYPHLPVSDDSEALIVGDQMARLCLRFKESGMTYKQLSKVTCIPVSCLRSYFNFTSLPSLPSYIKLIYFL